MKVQVEKMEEVVKLHVQAVQLAAPHLTEAEASAAAYRELLLETLLSFVRVVEGRVGPIEEPRLMCDLFKRFQHAVIDSRRLDALEKLLWSPCVGNGVALVPTIAMESAKHSIEIVDMGEENGANLGDELTDPQQSLRAAIDMVSDAHCWKEGSI